LTDYFRLPVGDAWPFPVAATDPTAALSLRDLDRDLDRALARISEEQRQVILLIGLEGTSYEEAATILDVPIGTFRSRLSRGRTSLRTLIDRRDGTEATNDAAVTRAARAVPKRRRKLSEIKILICCRCSRRSPVDYY
jgi:hypothetical protein